ncbi:MAG: hypothetical protein ABI186_07725, partial [Candidatus Elarobacter sp.]
FVVIAASALAALRQLRHMSGSNQITALTECRETLESRDFREAQRFVSFTLPERLKDPAECMKFARIPLVGEYEAIDRVANFFEAMGLFVKVGVIDRDIACDSWSYVVLRNWTALLPVTTYVREAAGTGSLWENFEYLALLCQRYDAEHPSTYPRDLPRMPKDTSLMDAIKEQRASLEAVPDVRRSP